MNSRSRIISISGIVLLAIAAFVVFVRVRYLNVPFERDEGEYAYGASLILQGKDLYAHLYSLKWPGVFVIYTVIIGILGKTLWAVHTGVLVFNLATAAIIYKALRRLTNVIPALIGAVSFMVMMVQKELQGIFANIEHFVVFFIAVSVLNLLLYWESGKKSNLIWCGISCGLALITKQQAIGFIATLGLVIAIRPFIESKRIITSVEPILRFALGVTITVLGVFLWVYLFDDFERFWFHTIVYASEYVGIASYADGWFELKKRILENGGANPGLWGAAVIGLFLLPRLPIDLHHKLLLSSLFLGGFIAMSFGLYYRPHYLMFMPLPAALLVGVLFERIYRWRDWVPALVCVLSVVVFMSNESDYLFKWSPNDAVSKIYHWEPFVATHAIGQYLRENSDPQDRVLVVGSEPQINFYAQRNTVTGYVYAYPLIEEQKYSVQMAEEWVAEINNGNPEFIVVMGEWITPISKNAGFYRIWDNSQKLIDVENYSLIGLIEVTHNNLSRETWGEDLQIIKPSNRYLYVYKLAR